MDYECTNVFVTFEKEGDRREVLKTLSVGKKYSRNDDPTALPDPKYMFEGSVLNVVESEHPNSIRWAELNIPVSEKLVRTTITSGMTCAIIYICTLAVALAEELSPGFGAAFTIASVNTPATNGI